MTQGIDVPGFVDPFEMNEASVRARLDTDADSELDQREGGIYQTLTEPMVKEQARVYIALGIVLQYASPLWAVGVYLDYKAAEYGLERKPHAKSVGTITINGTNGVFIPAGTRVAVPAPSPQQSLIRFITDEDDTISGGTVDIPITADSAGADSNVDADSITYLEDTISGVTSINNATPTEDGLDVEDDDDLRGRLLFKVNASQAAGSASDYVNWALSITGVSDVTVVPRWAGANTVKLVLLGPENNPVSQTVMDEVQRYLTGEALIADPTVEPTSADGGAGDLTGTFFYKYTWVTNQGDETAGSPASATITVASKNISLTDIAVGPTGVTSRRIYRATDEAGPYDLVQEITDNITTIHTDSNTSPTTRMPKTNNTTQFDGIAPVGARVSIDTPDVIEIDVVSALQFVAGYTLDGANGTVSIEYDIVAEITEYLEALPPGGDVVYKHLQSVIFDVVGVYDVTTLTIGGGTANIVLSDTEVASPGTIELS